MTKKLVLSVLASVVGFASSARAESYKVDPVHSSIVFSIKHLDVSNTYGRFNGATGTVEYDAANPALSSFDVQVQAKNIDTAVPQRDQHLRSADFLDVEKFAIISFKSTSVKPASEDALEVTGDLTLHGETKPITVTLKKTGQGQDPQGKNRIGFETQFTINRTEYGMKPFPGVGDEVHLTVALEAIQD